MVPIPEGFAIPNTTRISSKASYKGGMMSGFEDKEYPSSDFALSIDRHLHAGGCRGLFKNLRGAGRPWMIDIPDFCVTTHEHPSPTNPWGVKAIGESVKELMTLPHTTSHLITIISMYSHDLEALRAKLPEVQVIDADNIDLRTINLFQGEQNRN
jgi:hypothetical protein